VCVSFAVDAFASANGGVHEAFWGRVRFLAGCAVYMRRVVADALLACRHAFVQR
jgi:hypothetical protein